MGKPPLNYHRRLDLKISASDGSFSTSTTFTLTVTPVNDAPVIATPIADQTAVECVAWSFQVPILPFPTSTATA